MAAYAAVVSLKRTIEHILESSRVALLPPSPDIIQLVYREVETMQEIQERLDSSSISKSRKKVNALDARIREEVWEFEDLLESHLSDQILSQLERDRERDVLMLFSIDLQGLQHDVHSFIETLKDMKEEYIYELGNMPELEEDELGTLGFDSSEIMSEMVGLSDIFTLARNALTIQDMPNYVIYLIGMAGSGKTLLAKKVFEDPVTLRCFEHRAWVTVGRKCQFSEIAQSILAQVDPNIDTITQGAIDEYLRERFEGKRCLIVLDDVWDKQLLDNLANLLPDKSSAMIQILVTTRLRKVAKHGNLVPKFFGFEIRVRPLNEEESKDLLRQKVFGEEGFPPQLEKAAEKIAKNCEGLPLMIVTVGDILSKANNNEPEYWNEVAKKRSSVFIDAYNQISKVLFPTYDCLPQHLKCFFIYMGAFPQDYEILVSSLINLLTAERFTHVQNMKTIFDRRVNNFPDVWNHILIPQTWTTGNHYAIKTCGLYSWWWHFFNKEACKDKFLLILNSGYDAIEECVKGYRRLCLHSNFLFNMKDVYELVKCDFASTARSILCFGPYHPYSMPLDVGFKLLRVLDALKVRFYTFPVEILELVLLQYLALTYNGELPTSISRLFNLQFLIIHPHMSIKFCGDPSYVPVQIWDMQELKHIEILGRNLPDPKHVVSLQKLSTLVGVSANSCTWDVFKKIPNIRKLGIQIELTHQDGDSNPILSCFDHISELENLRTLKCSILNPEVKYGCVAPLTPPSIFPWRLQKLQLCGLGYPWKYMKVLGSLPCLTVLKLRSYAFRGPMWGTKRNSFSSLKYLVIEDTDLVQWKPRVGSFPWLERLIIKHCYKLEELHWPSKAYRGRIEIVDCNPLAVTCAQQLELRKKNYYLDITASSTVEDGKIRMILNLLKRKRN